jgi:hypothetical protein
MSSPTRRQPEYNTNTQQREQDQQQQQALSSNYSLNRCDKEYNIHQALEEVRKETLRYSQAITDFQVQAVDATHEITHNFLDSQKEIINSIQSAWTPVIQRTTNNNNNLTTATTTTNPFLFFSPGQIADIYARTVGTITEAYVASTRMATNVLFAGIEATRATTNYARQNAKEAARITSNTARTFAQTSRETVQVQ